MTPPLPLTGPDTSAVDDLVARLMADAPDMCVPAGTLLFGQGDEADRVFLLREGRVRLFVGDDAGGAETVLHVFKTGDLFGLPAVVGLQRYPVNAEALTPCRLAVAHRGALLARLAARPEEVTDLLAALGRRWRDMTVRLAEQKALQPPRRVKVFLWRQALAAGYAPGTAGPVAFRLPMSHVVAAGMLGLAPETLSRIFTRLVADGIRVRRRRVEIDDLAGLRAEVEGEAEGASPPTAG
ncbi:Crp/Fnr family transcriptional regulator [Caenispirillum salinarum]|uniref:Crp/Fnr family transcriptional regulator n=1 Tax=Caenispirillum salinarum TaxID=859058 RepID=UPI00384C6E11